MRRTCPSRTRASTWSSATRSCTTSPTSTAPSRTGASARAGAPATLPPPPALARAFAEFARVLRPGGAVVFAGGPSRHGDRLAARPKRAAARIAPLWRRAMRASAAPAGHADGGAHNHRLEAAVDVHAFTPAQLAGFARRAGFEHVRVTGEELLANWFGWMTRGLESTAVPDEVPYAWKLYAYPGYLALQRLDARLLEGRLPAAIFYNLMLSARTPRS